MNLLITGSVLNNSEDSLNTYSKLVEYYINKFENISSPIDTMEFNGSAQERYQRAMNLVAKADIIIADLSIPSTGQGMELQEAIRNNKKIIVIARNNSKVSGMIKSQLNKVIYYDSVSDIFNEINQDME